MSTPLRIRLAFSRVLWRTFAVLAILAEVGLYRFLRPWIANRSGAFRVAAMLKFSPKVLCRAFLWAALIAVVLDLYVRFLLKPAYRRWYASKRSPDDFDACRAFRLGPGEAILGETPARRQTGWRTQAGRLVKTADALWFAPDRWDREPWTIDARQVEAVFSRPKLQGSGNWVIGAPDPLVVRLNDGSEQVFHVGDPSQVLTWLTPSSN